MSKKYKELPAFETNEFKVGDLVKAYAGHLTEDLVYEIEEIRGNYLKLNREYTLAHFKQCRKLEEIKPREFYISTIIEYTGKPSIDRIGTAKISYFPFSGSFKVAEVLED